MGGFTLSHEILTKQQIIFFQLEEFLIFSQASPITFCWYWISCSSLFFFKLQNHDSFHWQLLVCSRQKGWLFQVSLTAFQRLEAGSFSQYKTVLGSPNSASGQLMQSNKASKIMEAKHSAQLKIHFQAAIEVGKIMERDCMSQPVLYLFFYALNFPLRSF